MKNIYPFIITLMSGLSTIIGYLSIYTKKNKEKIIKNALSLAAGTMTCISIIELIPESILLLKKQYIYLVISIIIGMTLPLIIEKTTKKTKSLYKIGILSMIAIIIHNIPEGIITYITTISNEKLGITIALAIALHNIPEGISIAIPIYYATNSKNNAFKKVLISALSEPIGAILATHLQKHITNKIMGIILSFTAGIMTTISIVVLMPEALKYKEKKKTIVFFIIGILIMYISIKLTK